MCGERHAARTAEREALYRQEGETALIVSGRLISGPWLCDSCGTTLAKGKTAVLSNSFLRWQTEATGEYDFAYERRHFDMRKVQVRAYGTVWNALVD